MLGRPIHILGAFLLVTGFMVEAALADGVSALAGSPMPRPSIR